MGSLEVGEVGCVFWFFGGLRGRIWLRENIRQRALISVEEGHGASMERWEGTLRYRERGLI